MNTEVLKDMACPKCKSEGPFLITTTAVATVADHGVVDVAGFDWNDLSDCTCAACKHEALVKDFTVSA